MVTGNAGVGKSTLAARLAQHLGLRVYNLDSIVWQPGWKPISPEERCRRIEEIVDQQSWIVDGVSSRLWRVADLVVFLDFDRRVSLVRCVRRNWRYLFRSRPGLPKGCPEILIVPTLLRIIWQFPTHVKPKLLADFEGVENKHRLLVIRSNADLSNLLNTLVDKVSADDASLMCGEHTVRLEEITI